MTLFNFQFDLGQWWRWMGRKPLVVLAVEDDPLTIELIRRAAGAHGFEVEAASTAEEAIGILHANGKRFVLALVDVRLPGMDGWTLRERIRDNWPTLEVVVMSGASDAFDDMPKGERLSILVKPANYGEFFSTIKP